MGGSTGTDRIVEGYARLRDSEEVEGADLRSIDPTVSGRMDRIIVDDMQTGEYSNQDDARINLSLLKKLRLNQVNQDNLNLRMVRAAQYLKNQGEPHSLDNILRLMHQGTDPITGQNVLLNGSQYMGEPMSGSDFKYNRNEGFVAGKVLSGANFAGQKNWVPGPRFRDGTLRNEGQRVSQHRMDGIVYGLGEKGWKDSLSSQGMVPREMLYVDTEEASKYIGNKLANAQIQDQTAMRQPLGTDSSLRADQGSMYVNMPVSELKDNNVIRDIMPERRKQYVSQLLQPYAL